MNSKLEAIKYISKTTLSEWRLDKVTKLAAGLAFYTLFLIPPLLLIAMGIGGTFFVEEGANWQLLAQLPAGNGKLSAFIGMVVLLLGVTGVLTELQDSLNLIWEAAPKKRKWLTGFLFAIGFSLLVSLVLPSLISISLKYAGNSVPLVEVAWQVISIVIGFVIVTVFFAAMFRFLPNAKIAWGDVWLGAVLTAFLFTIGKFFIGLYPGNLVLFPLWVFYSAHVFFLGAELTKAHARYYSTDLVLGKNAYDPLEKPFEINFRMTLDQFRRLFRTKKIVAASAVTLITLFILLRARQKNKAPF